MSTFTLTISCLTTYNLPWFKFPKRDWEELPHFQSQGQKPGGPHARRVAAKRSYPSPRSGAAAESASCNGTGMAEKSYSSLRSGAAARRSYPTSEVRGSSREELPYIRGQGPWPWGDTLHPRSEAAAGRSYPTPPRLRPEAVAGMTNPTSKEQWLPGTGGPRGAIPCWRSGRAVVRRYPWSKVRSSSCALLEQPWRDTTCPR